MSDMESLKNHMALVMNNRIYFALWCSGNTTISAIPKVIGDVFTPLSGSYNCNIPVLQTVEITKEYVSSSQSFWACDVSNTKKQRNIYEKTNGVSGLAVAWHMFIGTKAVSVDCTKNKGERVKGYHKEYGVRESMVGFLTLH